MLKSIEDDYYCGGFCYQPLFYLTHEITLGRNYNECISVILDDVSGEVLVPCYIMGTVLLLNFFFSLFLCQPVPNDFEEEKMEEKEKPQFNPLVGSWQAIQKSTVPRDEHLIVITRTKITFINGGGGFANGPYELGEDGNCVK